MVFPRVHFKEHMLTGAPPGTLGLANPSGWMNCELFLEVLRHFIKYTSSSKENPTLLLLDNHESHFSIEILNMAKQNGVTMLTLPPHCSSKLQPLDVAVYAPFKAHYNATLDSWMLRHPGIPVNIFHVAECVGTAFEKSMTPINIKSGFRKCGIFPFDRNIFTDDDYLLSSVTDRALPNSSVVNDKTPIIDLNGNDKNTAAESSYDKDLNNSLIENNEEHSNTEFITPEKLRGYPKAQPRKDNKTSKRKGSSKILTDTPEKLIIEEKQKEKERKNNLKVKKGVKRNFAEAKKVKVTAVSDSEDEELFVSDSSSDNFAAEENEFIFPETLEKPKIDSYVLVEFKDKKKIYYVGKIIKEEDQTDYQINFLRKSAKRENSFIFPVVPDIATVNIKDIKQTLPPPTELGKTKRQSAFINFEISFNSIDIR